MDGWMAGCVRWRERAPIGSYQGGEGGGCWGSYAGGGRRGVFSTARMAAPRPTSLPCTAHPTHAADPSFLSRRTASMFSEAKRSFGTNTAIDEKKWPNRQLPTSSSSAMLKWEPRVVTPASSLTSQPCTSHAETETDLSAIIPAALSSLSFPFPASHFALILLQDWRRQCVNEIFTLLPLAGLGWIVMASNSAKWRHSWLYQTTSTGWLSRNAVMCRWSFERMRLQVLRFFSSSRHLEMKRRHFQVSEFKVPTSLTHAQALVTKISSSGYCGHRDCKQGTFHCSFES